MIGKKINQLATELAPVSTDLTIIGDPISGVSKKITLAQLGAIFSGAVSFYTNLASFPVVGDINVIYCAKDTQKLYLWSGSAYTEVFPSQALLDTYQLRSEKGVSNGYASLDSGGKVPISQLPSSIMEYKGTWSASTNTPTLANGTGDTGDVYICNSPGSVNFGAGVITFAIGDYVIYSGTIWQRSSGAVGTVTSVAVSRSGDALAITGSPITTSGTINIGFAGTGTQYIKGDGTLATFPSIISQAQNLVTEVYNSTGATLTKGTIVYINGGQGNLPTVTKALATGDSTSAQTYGVVQNDITNMNNGYVVAAGRLTDLDTQAYTNGTQLYLSATTAGTWTSTKQYAPNHLVYVGIVVRAHPTQGVVEIKIQNGYEMDELHNVAAQTPSNNDGLFWEASTSLWKNKSIATILGYTPQAQLNGTGFVKASGTTITYDNSTYLTTSAAATTYLPMVLSSTAKDIDINGQTFDVSSKTSPFTSGRLIVTPTFSALGYQNSGVFNGFKILTDGSAEFSNSGITRFFNQVRFDNTLTNGTYNYTLPGASGTLALTSQLTGGTVTSVAALSLGTTGTDLNSTVVNSTTTPVITLNVPTASATNRGALSSTDWSTFNNKQNALTNPVTGTGTTNYLPKFTGTSTIGNSQVFDNGTNVGIGTTSPLAKLEVVNSAGSQLLIGYGGAADNYYDATNHIFRSASGAANRFTIDSTGAATFSSSVTAGSWINTANTFGLAIRNAANTAYRTAVQMNSSNVLIFGQDTDITALTFGVGSEHMRITSAGELCVGRTSAYGAGFLVNVQGNIYASAAIVAGSSVTAGSGSRFIVPSSVLIGEIQSGYSLIESIGSNGIWLRPNGITSPGGMFLTTGGNVGIGTTSPGTSKLYVLGDATNYGITSEAPSGYGKLILKQTSGQAWSVGLSSNDLFFYYGGASAGTRVTFANGGNVGIGTTSPTSLLHTYGTAAADNNLKIQNSVNGYANGIQLIANNDAGAGYNNIGSYTNGGNTHWLIGSGATTNTMVFYTNNNTERMRITSGGNVGIGTTSPGHKLSVIGNTYTEGIYVASAQFSQGGSATSTFYTLSNISSNRAFLITLRQAGGGANTVTGMCFIYGTNSSAYNLGQDNSNPALYLTISISGLDLKLTTGSGYGTTTWEYTITQIK